MYWRDDGRTGSFSGIMVRTNSAISPDDSLSGAIRTPIRGKPFSSIEAPSRDKAVGVGTLTRISHSLQAHRVLACDMAFLDEDLYRGMGFPDANGASRGGRRVSSGFGTGGCGGFRRRVGGPGRRRSAARAGGCGYSMAWRPITRRFSGAARRVRPRIPPQGRRSRPSPNRPSPFKPIAIGAESTRRYRLGPPPVRPRTRPRRVRHRQRRVRPRAYGYGHAFWFHVYDVGLSIHPRTYGRV